MWVLVTVSELNSNAIRLQIITEEIALTVRDARTDTFDAQCYCPSDLDRVGWGKTPTLSKNCHNLNKNAAIIILEVYLECSINVLFMYQKFFVETYQ